MNKPISPLLIALSGTAGKMGQALVQAIAESGDCRLVAAWDAPHSPLLNADAGVRLGLNTGVTVSSDSNSHGAQVLIDFTRPEATLAYLPHCRRQGVALVIGTTGFTPAQQQTIKAASADVAIVQAANMSLGVNAYLALLQQAARLFDAARYDTEIIEAHHRHKVDAPSGTALAMGEAIAQARNHSLADKAIYSRHGHTGPRQSGSIGFASLRGGDIVGVHTALFAGDGEQIEITLRSTSRASYAAGALAAARFAAKQAPKLYNMTDVLGLTPTP